MIAEARGDARKAAAYPTSSVPLPTVLSVRVHFPVSNQSSSIKPIALAARLLNGPADIMSTLIYVFFQLQKPAHVCHSPEHSLLNSYPGMILSEAMYAREIEAPPGFIIGMKCLRKETE